VATHLTVNFGLRWEPAVPSYDKYSRGNQFNKALFDANWHSSVYPNAPAGLVFAGDSVNKNGAALTASHWATFSPRLGIVWDPKGDGRQTIRTSFVLMHDTTELFYPERWTTNPPYASSITLTSPTSTFSNPWAGYPGGNPFPGAAIFPVGGTYVNIPPNVRPTYMTQWNFSYQRQLGRDWLLTADYLGNATRHLWGSYDIDPSCPGASLIAGYSGPFYDQCKALNVPNPSAATNNRRFLYFHNPAQGQYYSNIQTTDDGGSARYNALLVKMNHRFANHFTLLSNYTWSHCVSDVDFTGELAGPVYQNPFYRSGERSSCSFDHRHIFNTSAVLTSGGLGGGLIHTLTRDWTASPIVSLLSGAPITLTDGGKDISLSGQLQDRPNVILPNQVYPSDRTTAEWFNPAAFAVQPSGTFGNLGRLSLNAPGIINFDVAFSRRFTFSERWKLDFRSDFFNIMNHANWNSPTTSISSAQFGQITSFGSPRIIQMSMKLFF
jgi:hypothetical protein